MSIAVYVKTESCDEYLYCFEGDPSPDDLIDNLKNALGDEFAYVSEVVMSFNEKDYGKQEKLEDVIMRAIEEEQERMTNEE